MTSTIPASASPFQAIDSQLESIYAPIADDLCAVRQLYQQTILESSERRHLHDVDRRIGGPNSVALRHHSPLPMASVSAI